LNAIACIVEKYSLLFQVALAQGVANIVLVNVPMTQRTRNPKDHAFIATNPSQCPPTQPVDFVQEPAGLHGIRDQTITKPTASKQLVTIAEKPLRAFLHV